MLNKYLLILLLVLSQSIWAERIEKGALVLENIPEIPIQVKQGINQYTSIRSASFKGWLADDAILISTRFGETSQLHSVSSPGAARVQRTFFAEPVRAAAVNPDLSKHTVLYTRDGGGSEYYQLYALDLSTGKSKRLSDGKSRNGGPLWQQDGDVFAYSSTKRNGKDTDIYLRSIDGDDEKLLVDEGGYWWPIDFNYDGSSLLVQKYVSANESYLYSADTRTGKLTPVVDENKKIAIGDALFSVDGKSVYYLSDAGSEFTQIHQYNLGTKKDSIISEPINWNITGLALSSSGQYLAYMANFAGMSQVYVKNLKTNKNIELPDQGLGVISNLSFHPKKNVLAFTMSKADSPANVYTTDIDTQIQQKWTNSEVGGLNAKTFIKPRLEYYPTFDEVDGKKRKIPLYFYQPPMGWGPFPVVIMIHGGPEGQSRPYFNSLIQYITRELNIAVLTPNVRGSSGYGKSYLKLDNGFKREDSVKDIGALLDWIKTNPKLINDQVVVFGGSYGGYMSLAAMTHYSDRLLGGIDIVGISNFVTFLENTKGYRRDLRRVEYGDERDPEMRAFLEKISPSNNAEKISKPLFIIQGLNDPRVPASEAEQILNAVKGEGGEPWYLLAKNEGHGFRKRENRQAMYESISMFLQKVVPAARLRKVGL
ncbi:MAG: S9 family peptidase [bacterium]